MGNYAHGSFSFLEAYDFSGKTIIPFCTHEGSSLENSEKDIKRICPDSKLLKGLSVWGNKAEKSDEEIQKWLKKHKRIGNVIMTKKFIALLLIFIFTFTLTSCGNDKQQDESSTPPDNSSQKSNDKSSLPQSDDNNKGEETEDKILIAYFTRTNNTKKIAQQIHERVGGDLIQIVTVNSYPEDYNECTAQASKELEEDFRPELQTIIENMADYDVIYLGYPNWWGTIPMPIATFLESYNFSGKTIIPFCTHGSSRLGRSEAHISELAPQATLREGLAIQGSNVDSAQDEVEAWLKNLGEID